MTKRGVVGAALLFSALVSIGTALTLLARGLPIRVAAPVALVETRESLELACKERDGARCDRLGTLDALSYQSPRDERRAIVAFELGCQAKNARACAHYGMMIEHGVFRPSVGRYPESFAIHHYREACDAGEVRGCVLLAEALGAGRGEPTDFDLIQAMRDKARPILNERCDEGDAELCGLAGLLEIWKVGGQSRDRLVRGCAGGDPLSCVNLASVELRSGLEVQGLARLEDACERGFASACNNLGVLATRISFQTRSGPGGERVYKLQCEQGITVGCSAWGERHENKEVQLDLPKAAGLFESACTSGLQLACVNLGGLLYSGRGVAKDRVRAVKLFEDACELGEPSGCAEAGALELRTIPGVATYVERGVSLLAIACRSGERDACVVQASCMLQGIGMPKDVERATERLAYLYNGIAPDTARFDYFDALMKRAAIKRGRGDREGAEGDEGMARHILDVGCEKTGRGCAQLVTANDIAPPKKRALLEQGCKLDDSDSCEALAATMKRGSASDRKAAIAILEKACDLGDDDACVAH